MAAAMGRRPPAAQTAFGPMVVVAIEQTYPAGQRLVQDSLAVRLLPAGVGVLVWACRWRLLRRLLITLAERRAPGVWGSVLCRKRYADDAVTAANDAGLRQVVILGAGLDTRVYRLAAPRGVAGFELDLPANIQYKAERLRRAYGRLPDTVALVPVDFETDDPRAALVAHGFRLDQPAVVVWEAVTQYLTEVGVRKTLAALSDAAVGSRLIFTYVRADFLRGARLYDAQNLYREFVARQRLWRFGLEPEHVADLLGDFGWTEREQLGRAELTRRYLAPIGRQLAITEIERVVAADKV